MLQRNIVGVGQIRLNRSNACYFGLVLIHFMAGHICVHWAHQLHPLQYTYLRRVVQSFLDIVMMIVAFV